jgi:predicted nucleic acid-binding protein
VADRKLRLYFDTTIPNYLFVKEGLGDTEAARLILERHSATCLLWERCAAEEYDAFVSEVFDRELRACPEPKLGRMREKMTSVKIEQLVESEEVQALAAEYVRSGIMLPKDYNDCLHIAYAVVNGCDVILSWNFGNFRHIVNDATRGKVRVVNAVSRYNEILIFSPDDFLAGGH